MFNLILVSCLLVQACQGLALARTDVRSILGDPQSDAYIDQILENLRQMIQEQGLDPMTLPDLETGFSDTILGITWHGSATVRRLASLLVFRSHLSFPAEKRPVLGPLHHRQDRRHQLHCGGQHHGAHRHAQPQGSNGSLRRSRRVHGSWGGYIEVVPN